MIRDNMKRYAMAVASLCVLILLGLIVILYLHEADCDREKDKVTQMLQNLQSTGVKRHDIIETINQYYKDDILTKK